MKQLYFFTLMAALLLGAGCASLAPAPRGERYFDLLTPGNKVYGGGATYLIEKSPDNYFILKQFYYETRQITSKAQYKDATLKIQHGPCQQWRDDGQLLFEGYYIRGKKSGFWKEYSMLGSSQGGYGQGEYSEGEKTGTWMYKDTLGRLNRLIQFEAGEPASYLKVNADGTSSPDTSSRDAGPDSLQVAPSFRCNPSFAALGKECSERSLMKYLATAVKYPLKARQRYITGNALVSFVIDKDGQVCNVEVLNGVCDDIKAECYRVISNMPTWEPGYAKGKPVKVRYSLPIRFKLE